MPFFSLSCLFSTREGKNGDSKVQQGKKEKGSKKKETREWTANLRPYKHTKQTYKHTRQTVRTNGQSVNLFFPFGASKMQGVVIAWPFLVKLGSSTHPPIHPATVAKKAWQKNKKENIEHTPMVGIGSSRVNRTHTNGRHWPLESEQNISSRDAADRVGQEGGREKEQDHKTHGLTSSPFQSAPCPCVLSYRHFVHVLSFLVLQTNIYFEV